MAGESIAAGAAAGSSFGPWGTAIGAGLGALKDASGGGVSSSGPSRLDSASSGNRVESIFDSSGWNINFGAGGIESSADKAPAQSWILFAGLAVVGLIAWKMLNK